MYSNQKLVYKLGNSKSINQVEPTRSLLIQPMPCEQRAAHIRNQTVKAMKEDNIAEVCFRYIQSKAGQRNAGQDAMRFIVITMAAVWLLRKLNNISNESENASTLFNIISIFLVLPTMFSVGFALPNTANSLRYYKTKEACATWLKEKLGKEDFAKIDKLVYEHQNKSALLALENILQEAGIDTSSLEQRIAKEMCKFP